MQDDRRTGLLIPLAVLFAAFLAALAPTFACSQVACCQAASPASRTGPGIAAGRKPRKKSSKKVEVWELSQDSRLVGPVRSLVSPSAVKIQADKMGITWLFKGPDWDVFLYNMETHSYCRFPYEQWKKKVFFNPAQSRIRQKEMLVKQLKLERTGKTEKIADRSAEKVVIKAPRGNTYGVLYVTSSVVAPPQFAEAIGSMMMIPVKSTAVPLRVQMMRRQGKVMRLEDVLDTEKIRRVQVDSSIFEPLTGFKRVDDEMTLLLEGSIPTGDEFDLSPDEAGGHRSQAGRRRSGR